MSSLENGEGTTQESHRPKRNIISKPLDDAYISKWDYAFKDDARVCYATCDCVRWSFSNPEIREDIVARTGRCKYGEVKVPVEIMEKYVRGKADGKKYKLVHEKCRGRFPMYKVDTHLPHFYLLEDDL